NKSEGFSFKNQKGGLYFRNFYMLLAMATMSFPIKLLSQDPFIFSNDRFSGISAVGISPTQNFINPNGWALHLFSENIFIQNEYGYISKTSILGLTSGEIKEADIGENITGENT